MPVDLVGGWEVGLVLFIVVLYLVGVYLNPTSSARRSALFSIVRDASRFGVMAVGVTFVIVNKDLDLSVGSLYGLTAAVFSIGFSPSYFDGGVVAAIVWALAVGLARRPDQRRPRHLPAGSRLHRDADHAVHRPRRRHRPVGRQDDLLPRQGEGNYPDFFFLGDTNAWGFNNQIFVFALFVVDRRAGAGQDADRLRDLRDRGQRARGKLCRHPDPLGADARLPALGLLRVRSPG